MAEPVEYRPRPTPTEPSAYEELDRLVQTLHEQGLLRLANDLASANKGIVEILVRGLTTPGAQNALQNLGAAAMVLGRVPPGTFYRVADAARLALERLTEGSAEHPAPGVRGAYRLLNDDDAWRTLGPLAEALGVFGRAMSRPPPERPITEYSGKESEA